jgi:hypothetical protein
LQTVIRLCVWYLGSIGVLLSLETDDDVLTGNHVWL